MKQLPGLSYGGRSLARWNDSINQSPVWNTVLAEARRISGASPRLNVLTSRPEDIRAAFELMGDEVALDAKPFFSLAAALGSMHAQRAMLLEDQKHGGEGYGSALRTTTGVTINGADAWHRYFLRLDGTLCFSFDHGKSRALEAALVGFEIFA